MLLYECVKASCLLEQSRAAAVLLTVRALVWLLQTAVNGGEIWKLLMSNRN